MRSLLLLALCLLPALPANGQEGAPNFAAAVAARLELGDPIQTDQAILFPLVLADAPTDVGVDTLASGTVTFAEPEKSARRDDVLARNGGARPVLVLGGTLLEGGKRDRLLANDTIVAPGAEAILRALPAASAADTRAEPAPFKVASSLAPLYLRRKAEFSTSQSLVPTFVAQWIDFRNEGDKRDSLVAICESNELAEYSLRSREGAAGLPKGLAGRTVVGAIGAIRGRVQMLTVFGTNGLVEAHFDAFARAAMFGAAAIEIRAKAANVPLPGKGDPAKTLDLVRKDAQELLSKLKTASYKKAEMTAGEAGDALLVRLGGGARGRAVGLGGALVHLSIYPYDPVEARLYASAVDPDKKPEPEEEKAEEEEEEARPTTSEEDDFIDGFRDRVRGGRGGRR
jgi:hypothetical protein